MRTKKITLFYQLTQTEIFPPSAVELERKDNWIKEVQKTVEADYKPKIIKTTYEIFDPECDKQRKFFNGVCVLYWAIQSADLITGMPDYEVLKDYREELLDEMLGYDVRTVNRVIRKRKSTTDFKTVQAWQKFLQTLEETLFFEAGFDFPDSEEFWKLDEQYGYDQAKTMSVKRLQTNLKRKQ